MEFQSPSLRGSGRFQGALLLGARAPGFNPLHCGAVVASLVATAMLIVAALVSIPFIAGQWSLPNPDRAGWTPPLCFNPLHCGAVVASHVVEGDPALSGVFQSPSLRGSGRFERRAAKAGADLAFQSPSLRGSGRFTAAVWRAWQEAGFNPLHCGAVVASGGTPGGPSPLPTAFQSPSLRGSGRFSLS